MHQLKQLLVRVVLSCGVLAGANVLWAATEALPDANGVVKITSSGSFELRQDVKQVVVSDGNAKSVLEVTLDLNGHSISNAIKTTRLLDNAENLVLTNSSALTWSYIDGMRVQTVLNGRGIYNASSVTMRFGGRIMVRNCWANIGAAVYTEGHFIMTGGQLGEDLGEMVNDTNWSNQATRGGNIYGDANNASDSASITITGGKICNGLVKGDYGGGMCAWFKCNVTLGGTTRFVNNRGNCGGGIEIGNGTSMTIDGEDVVIAFNHSTGNSNQLSGGGVAVGLDGRVPNTLILNAGNIVSNVAEGAALGGGGVYMRGEGSSRGELQLKGGRIADNVACGYGGGIYTYGAVYVDGCEVVNNVSTNSGGGIYMYQKKEFEITSGSISSNVCLKGNGGGIYAQGPITVSNGRIIGNQARKGGGSNMGRGGGIYINNTAGESVQLTGGEISDNFSEDSGGGLFSVSSAFTLKGGLLQGNEALNCGGAIYVHHRSLTVNGGVIRNNKAGGDGGGVYTKDAHIYFLQAVTVADNRADGNGGGLALDTTGGKIAQLEGGRIEGNTAAANGGGVWMTGRGNKIDSHIGPAAEGAVSADSSLDIHIRNNRARNGGGIYMRDGAYMIIQGGYICHNMAVGDPAADFTSAAYTTNGRQAIEGCGGGIYLSGEDAAPTERTIVEFVPKDENGIGIYANEADNAADDVLAEGVGTKAGTGGYTRLIGLPGGANMRLDEMAGAEVKGWYEDYHVADTSYLKDKSTFRLGETGTNVRYRTLRATASEEEIERVKVDDDITHPDGANGDCRYFCLTLGYTIPQPTLWIADHADAGTGKIHLAVCPTFPNGAKLTPDLVQQIAPRFRAVVSAGSATDEDLETIPAAEWMPVALRDPKGELDIERGLIWLTVSLPAESDAAKRFVKIVYCPE